MADNKTEQHADSASNSSELQQQADQMRQDDAIEQVDDLKRRTKAMREEVFEELDHIPGYSDAHGASNLALIYFVDDDEDEEAEESVAAEESADTQNTSISVDHT